MDALRYIRRAFLLWLFGNSHQQFFRSTVPKCAVLCYDDRKDGKAYGRTLQQHFDKYTLHSGNVYQIFTYVKNQDKDNKGNIAGILLYAKTDEAITPDHMFNIGGDQIGAKTLDLNTDFKVISMQLDKIAFDFFGGNNEIELITAN